MAGTKPTPAGGVTWERQKTDVHDIIDEHGVAGSGESPLQRIDRRVSNIQSGTEASLKLAETSITMIREHSKNDESALQEINDKIAAQDKTQLDHTIELRAQSRQLDTIVSVIAPRSGSTTEQLRKEIRDQIAATDKAHTRKRNIELLKIAGAVTVALLGATGGIAAIIKLLHH